MLWGLLNYSTEEQKSDYRYDVVSGVSIGSINASAFAVYELGQESDAVELIYQTW